MFYIKLFFSILWFILACSFGLVFSILFWGSKNINHIFARVFSWGILKILGIHVEVQNVEHIQTDQSAIYLANHQSNLDMATFGCIYPKGAVVIGKKEVAWIPLFGLFYMAAGNILIDRKKTNKAVAGLNQATDAVRSRGVSIWMFPEGTRNRFPNGLLPFKRGAFHMAIQAQIPIIPMVAGPLGVLFDWKKRKSRSGTLKVVVLPSISTKGLTTNDVDRLAHETREKMQEAFLGLISQAGPV